MEVPGPLLCLLLFSGKCLYYHGRVATLLAKMDVVVPKDWSSSEHGSASTIRTMAPEVYSFVKNYAKSDPCFFIEELQESILENFPNFPNISVPTICRALRDDLKLSRKVLEKRVRESMPIQLKEYY